MLQEHRHLEGRRIATQGPGVLRVERIEDCARFSLRVTDGNIALASKAFGCDLPRTIGATSDSGARLALCLGPDEWQLLAPLDGRDAIEAKFAALYPKMPHSLVDVSHREVGIVVEGTGATLALRSACPLDLRDMAVATVTRTVFDKAQIILFREGENRFRIEVWQSFADHVWGILQAAGREIELGI